MNRLWLFSKNIKNYISKKLRVLSRTNIKNKQTRNPHINTLYSNCCQSEVKSKSWMQPEKDNFHPKGQLLIEDIQKTYQKSCESKSNVVASSKCWKKNSQPRILYFANISFKGRLKTSWEEQNLQTPFSIPDKIIW